MEILRLRYQYRYLKEASSSQPERSSMPARTDGESSIWCESDYRGGLCLHRPLNLSVLIYERSVGTQTLGLVGN